MNKKSLYWMAGTALVLGALALGLDTMRESGAAWRQANEPLFPDLRARIAEARTVTVQSATDTTTLEKDGDTWRVRERGGYAARGDEVGRVLLALAEAERSEPKTALPARYEKLGLGGFEDESSPTVRVTVKDADGEVLADLMVGQRRHVGVGEGWYVREPEQEVTWSVSGRLRTPKRTAEWLQTELFDVSRDRIARVRVVHADGDDVHLLRPDEEAPAFEIENIPQGREPKTERTAAAFLGSLANLRLSDVKPADEVEFPTPPETETTWWTRGGLRITAELLESGDELLCRFDAAFDPAAAPKPEMGPGAPADGEAEGAGEEAAGGDEEAPDPVAVDLPEEPPSREELEEEAAKIRALAEGWVFVLPSWKKSSFVTHMEDLLVELPEEPAPGEDPPGEGGDDGGDDGGDEGGDEGSDDGAPNDGGKGDGR